MSQRFVYFVRPAAAVEPFKIGSARNVEQRFANLQASSPVKLELIAFAPGDYSIERKLHWRHIDTHSHGEWFNVSPLLLSDIAAVQNGMPLVDLVQDVVSLGPLWKLDHERATRPPIDEECNEYATRFRKAKLAMKKAEGVPFHAPAQAKEILRAWVVQGHRPDQAEIAYLDECLSQPRQHFVNTLGDVAA